MSQCANCGKPMDTADAREWVTCRNCRGPHDRVRSFTGSNYSGHMPTIGVPRRGYRTLKQEEDDE